MCRCGDAVDLHDESGCLIDECPCYRPVKTLMAEALPHVHEWGDWEPAKLQRLPRLEYAWCPCGASKARRAEPAEGVCTADSHVHEFGEDCVLKEPEEGVCVCDHPEGDHAAGHEEPYDGCNWCKKERCGRYRPEPEESFECPGWPECPGIGSCSACAVEPAPKELAPRRRPPYAVAYAVEGGALYEVALSGDATVIAEDGVLQIIHPSKAVLGITRVTPMTIEERSADDGAQ